MDWKEFLKPTLFKFVLALALSIAFLPYLTQCCPSDSRGGCGTVHQSLLSAWLFKKDMCDWETNIIIEGAIVSYLAACALIFLYFKLDKRKSKKQ